MKFPNKDFFKKNKKVLIAGTTAGVATLIAFLVLAGRTRSYGYSDGYITCGDESSDTIENLFYQSEDNRYLVELEKLDKCMDLVVIPSDGSYIIRTSKVQCTVRNKDSSYDINTNTIRDDDNYIAPVESDKGFYADADTIFSIFGYETTYKTSKDGNLVEMVLQKSDSSSYGTLHIEKEQVEENETRNQIEEGILNQNPTTGQPGSSKLPIVPRPESNISNSDVNDATKEEQSSSSAPQSEEEFLENGGIYPEDVQDVIDNRPEQIETEAPKKIIDRPDTTQNKKSDEEFQQQWDQISNTLSDAYSKGTTPTGTEPGKKRTDDFIAYNPMSGALYYDTISILHDPSDGAFIEATFSDEWSDLAMNTDHEKTKAFYESVPGMVETTLKSILGNNMGEELFLFIKENADRTQTGGYISHRDENNEIQTEWTDGPVGDGINAEEIDFENWQGKVTDDGLRFYVARSGNGFFVKVYKN